MKMKAVPDAADLTELALASTIIRVYARFTIYLDDAPRAVSETYAKYISGVNDRTAMTGPRRADGGRGWCARMLKGDDVDKLKVVINRYFRTYDVRWEMDSAAFFVDLDPANLEKDFNTLRRDLLVRGYVPMVLFEGGEHIIYVQKRPLLKFRSIKWNVAMLLLTILTTVMVGAVNWWSYDNLHMNSKDIWQVFTPRAIGYGALFFAFPLMTILGIHELGHYMMARRHGVAASLPFFIPMPVPPLGTFGAFISMREPIPNKKALLDIGVAGPLCGFAVAVPVIILGFKLTQVFAMPVPPDATGLVYLGRSVFFDALAMAFPTGNYMMHPTALAGWVGLLVTFLNLLPAGQLDGGHVARAMFGDKAKYFSYASIILMLALSFYFQYFGWILFIFILVFLGIGHPPPLNDITPLDGKRWVTGVVVFTLLAGCFTPVPMYQATINHDGSLGLPSNSANMGQNSTANLTAVVTNWGNVDQKFTLVLKPWSSTLKAGWNASFNNTTDVPKMDVTVPPDKDRNVTFYIRSPANASLGDQGLVNITLTWKDDSGKRHSKGAMVEAQVGFVTILPAAEVQTAWHGQVEPNKFQLTDLANRNMTVVVGADLPAGWGIEFGQNVFEFTPTTGCYLWCEPGADSWYQLIVPANAPVSTFRIELWAKASWTERVNGTDMNRNTDDRVKILVNVLQFYDVGLDFDRDAITVHYGSKAVVNVTVDNRGNGMDHFDVKVTAMANLSASPANTELTIDPGRNASFLLTIEPLANRTADMNLLVMVSSAGDPAVIATRTIEVRVET
jgi:Zn-dependent protease